jgi:hypothetical protein
MSIPASHKHWLDVDVGIDDRADSCERWDKLPRIRPMLLAQPWNADSYLPRWSWEQIVEDLL